MKLSRLSLSLCLFSLLVLQAAHGELPPDGMRYFAKEAAEQLGKDTIDAAQIFSNGLENTGRYAVQELTKNPIQVRVSVDANTIKHVGGLILIAGGVGLVVTDGLKKIGEQNPQLWPLIIKGVVALCMIGGGGYLISS